MIAEALDKATQALDFELKHRLLSSKVDLCVMDAQQEKIFEKAFGSLFTKHKKEAEDAKTGGSLAAVGTQPTGPASLVQKGWIKNGKDAAQLTERGCSALFYDERGQKCSCADRLTQTIAARSVDNKTTLYADPHWRLIQDAQRTEAGLHPLGLLSDLSFLALRS